MGSESGPRALGAALWPPGCGLQGLGSGLWVLGSGVRGLGSGLLRSWFQALVSGLGVLAQAWAVVLCAVFSGLWATRCGDFKSPHFNLSRHRTLGELDRKNAPRLLATMITPIPYGSRCIF